MKQMRNGRRPVYENKLTFSTYAPGVFTFDVGAQSSQHNVYFLGGFRVVFSPPFRGNYDYSRRSRVATVLLYCRSANGSQSGIACLRDVTCGCSLWVIGYNLLTLPLPWGVISDGETSSFRNRRGSMINWYCYVSSFGIECRLFLEIPFGFQCLKCRFELWKCWISKFGAMSWTEIKNIKTVLNPYYHANFFYDSPKNFVFFRIILETYDTNMNYFFHIIILDSFIYLNMSLFVTFHQMQPSDNESKKDCAFQRVPIGDHGRINDFINRPKTRSHIYQLIATYLNFQWPIETNWINNTI